MTGETADQVRRAESRRLDGDPASAVVLLEEALCASERARPDLPGWLCGRLAALYRSVGRYDDEVSLLERYRDSQRTEEARSRYDARLSKARTIAERKRPRDSGALRSIRASMSRPSRASTRADAEAPLAAELSATLRASLTLAVQASKRGASHGETAVAHCFALMCAEARGNGVPIESLVAALRYAHADVYRAMPNDAHETAFALALVELLAVYFEERR